jgi:hemerythrin superfamily protein
MPGRRASTKGPLTAWAAVESFKRTKKEPSHVTGIDLLKRQHDEVEELFDQLGEAAADKRIALLGRIAEALTLHSALEERHLYPLAKEAGFEERVNHSLSEHAEVKRLTAEILQTRRSDPKLSALSERLMESVLRHVEEEERDLFPSLEEKVGPERLEALGQAMEREVETLSHHPLLEEAEAQHTPQA